MNYKEIIEDFVLRLAAKENELLMRHEDDRCHLIRRIDYYKRLTHKQNNRIKSLEEIIGSNYKSSSNSNNSDRIRGSSSDMIRNGIKLDVVKENIAILHSNRNVESDRNHNRSDCSDSESPLLLSNVDFIINTSNNSSAKVQNNDDCGPCADSKDRDTNALLESQVKKRQHIPNGSNQENKRNRNASSSGTSGSNTQDNCRNSNSQIQVRKATVFPTNSSSPSREDSSTAEDTGIASELNGSNIESTRNNAISNDTAQKNIAIRSNTTVNATERNEGNCKQAKVLEPQQRQLQNTNYSSIAEFRTSKGIEFRSTIRGEDWIDRKSAPSKQRCITTVRSKVERAALPGFSCDQCARFYEAMLQQGIITDDNVENFGRLHTCTHKSDGDKGEGRSRKEVLQDWSRHKAEFTPDDTPEGFWNVTLSTPDNWK